MSHPKSILVLTKTRLFNVSIFPLHLRLSRRTCNQADPAKLWQSFTVRASIMSSFSCPNSHGITRLDSKNPEWNRWNPNNQVQNFEAGSWKYKAQDRPSLALLIRNHVFASGEEPVAIFDHLHKTCPRDIMLYFRFCQKTGCSSGMLSHSCCCAVDVEVHSGCFGALGWYGGGGGTVTSIVAFLLVVHMAHATWFDATDMKLYHTVAGK